MSIDIRETTEQQRRSRIGRERVERKLTRRYGLQLQRRSVLDGLTIKRGSDQPVLQIVEAPEAHAFEVQVTNNNGATWLSPDGSEFRGDKASDLLPLARKLAIADTSRGVRIVRPGGARAVHCFNFKKR